MKRFRVTNEQKARIEITKLDQSGREAVLNARDNDQELMRIFKMKQYSRWLKLVPEVIENWNDQSSLTREEAMAGFTPDVEEEPITETMEEQEVS